MDLIITCKAPTLYGDPSYDSDDSMDSEINKSSISTSLSSPVLTSSNSEQELKVIPPIFSFLPINTWLLATWTFQPKPRYLRNPNLSKLRDAPTYGIYQLEPAPESRLKVLERISSSPCTLQQTKSQRMQQPTLLSIRSAYG